MFGELSVRLGTQPNGQVIRSGIGVGVGERNG